MIERYQREEMARLWGDQRKFDTWLEVELAVVDAFANKGLLSKEKAQEIRSKASVSVERIFEIEAETRHDVLAFLGSLEEQIGEDTQYVHRGMTSNDLVDTALALQIKSASALIFEGIERLMRSVHTRAMEHKETPCIARSHGIHAQPTSFGLKLAGFYAELDRSRVRLERAVSECLVGKISGAVGTYAEIEPSIEADALSILGLQTDSVSTQVVARDRHAHLMQCMALVGSAIERIAVEVRHLQRTEVGEAREAFRKGQKGSSAMPHKRNPILSENLTGLARLLRSYCAPSQENIALWHERDISHSSVERVILPDAFCVLDFMLHRISGVIERLEVDAERMLENLESTRGLIHSGSLLVALCEAGMGREEAYKRIQVHARECWSGGAPLLERVLSDERIREVLSEESVRAVFDTARHLRFVDTIFERTFSVAGKR